MRMLLLAVVLAACAAPQQTPSRPSADPAPAQTTTVERTLRHDGVERRYILQAPPARGGGKRPVAIVMHGGGGHGGHAAEITRFAERAAQHDFITVYPTGTPRNRLLNKWNTWNAVHCCGAAMEKQSDDVGFINALIDAVIRTENADPARIYLSGMSNGGMMAHRAAIALSDKVAAVAPVIATLFDYNRRPSSPVPALIIDGALDEILPVAGGRPNVPRGSYDGTPLQPAAYQAQYWARANGCDAAPTRSTTASGRVEIEQYRCPAGRDVTRYLVRDGAHSWPGGAKIRRGADDPSRSLDATAVILDFFLRHPRN